MQLFVSKNGQRYGPYSPAELRREVLADVFRPEHFASADHCRTWNPISAVSGLGPLEFEVESDRAAHLLVIRYHGCVRAADVAHCAQEVEEALTTLSPGFRLLVDLTALGSMEVDCAPPLERIMRVCNERGVHTVVRVIPNPRCDIGLGIMSCFHYRPEVQFATCRSSAEAQELLDRPPSGAVGDESHSEAQR